MRLAHTTSGQFELRSSSEKSSHSDCIHKERRINRLQNNRDFSWAIKIHIDHMPTQAALVPEFPLYILSECQVVALCQYRLDCFSKDCDNLLVSKGPRQGLQHIPVAGALQISMLTACALLRDMFLHACICFTKSVQAGRCFGGLFYHTQDIFSRNPQLGS